MPDAGVDGRRTYLDLLRRGCYQGERREQLRDYHLGRRVEDQSLIAEPDRCESRRLQESCCLDRLVDGHRVDGESYLHVSPRIPPRTVLYYFDVWTLGSV